MKSKIFMKFKNIYNLNYLFIFLYSLLAIIRYIAALYSAADGNFHPWAIKAYYKIFIFFILMITNCIN